MSDEKIKVTVTVSSGGREVTASDFVEPGDLERYASQQAEALCRILDDEAAQRPGRPIQANANGF